MNLYSIREAAGCICALLLVVHRTEGQKLQLNSMVQGEASKSWCSNEVAFEKNGHGVLAYLGVTYLSQAVADSRVRFYAKFLDSSGHECFSLILSQELTSRGKRTEPFQPGETRTLLSATASIFPAVRPVTAQVYVLREVPTGQRTRWTENGEVICVPPTIMGGIPGDRDILSARDYDNPYLGLASISVDSKGLMLQSSATNAASAELRDGILTFLKALRFNPGISGKSAVPSRFLILFVKQESKVFSGDSTWPWDVPWVIDAVRKAPVTESLPVVVELAFHFRFATASAGAGLEYLPLGSDWCPMLFSWTTDSISGRPVRTWDPHTGLEER